MTETLETRENAFCAIVHMYRNTCSRYYDRAVSPKNQDRLSDILCLLYLRNKEMQQKLRVIVSIQYDASFQCK